MSDVSSDELVVALDVALSAGMLVSFGPAWCQGDRDGESLLDGDPTAMFALYVAGRAHKRYYPTAHAAAEAFVEVIQEEDDITEWGDAQPWQGRAGDHIA